MLRASRSSGGSVARSARECHYGGALLPETLTRCASYAFFIPNRLQVQVLDALEIKNPLRSRNGFLVVDYTIEISNLDLVKDMAEVVEYLSNADHQIYQEMV